MYIATALQAHNNYASDQRRQEFSVPPYSTRSRNLIKFSGASPSAPSRAAAIFRRTIL